MDAGGGEAYLGSRYVLLDEIGAGAMGTVWRARHRETGEIVAVKLLRSNLAADQDLVLRFVQERNVLRTLRHPNIVTMRDFVIEGERLALVMDLVEGGDLRTLLRQHGTLPPAAAARLMAEMADALATAHAVGVVHRDIKPGNVLIDGPTGQVRLTDFGVARIVHGPGLTQTTSIIGTPTYLSPEVADGGAATPAVDVYALGLILYELLAGRPPFVGEHPMALLRQHAMAAPRRLSGMPDALWGVISTCTAKEPGGRPSAGEVAARLREASPALAGLPALVPVTRDDAPSATSEPMSGGTGGTGAGLGAAATDPATGFAPRAAGTGATGPAARTGAATDPAARAGTSVTGPAGGASAAGTGAGAGMAATGPGGGAGGVPTGPSGGVPTGPGGGVPAGPGGGVSAGPGGGVPTGPGRGVSAGFGGKGGGKRSGRQRVVVGATVAAAVAVSAAAVVVMAPWRPSDAGATYEAAAVSTPSANRPVDAAATVGPGEKKESPSESKAKKTPKAHTPSPTEAVSEPPEPKNTATAPARRTRTPDPKRTTAAPKTDDKGTVAAIGDGDKDGDGDEGGQPQETQPKWQCRSWASTGSGTGVEMSPCMAMVGDTFHVMGRIRGSSSVRSDIHVQLYNTDADANVSQPFVCGGVTPPQGGIATCGPFTVTAPRIGAKHDVRQRWRKTGAASFGGGAESPWVLW